MMPADEPRPTASGTVSAGSRRPISPARERPLRLQEREDLRGRRREPLLGPVDAPVGEHRERQAPLGAGPRPTVDGVVGQPRGLVPEHPQRAAHARGGAPGCARRRGRRRPRPATGWPCARPPTGRPTRGRWSAARRARRSSATTSSVCVAATCRCRTASRARRSATSTNRVTTRRACHPRRQDRGGPHRTPVRPSRCTARRDHPVTMHVIVPGATSVNPASRTATAAPASTARHSSRPRRGPRVPHGERGHVGQAARRRVQHRRVPHLRRRLADRHLQRRVHADHRHAGRRRAGDRPARGRCRRSAAGRRSWARRRPGRGRSARACASPTVTVTPGSSCTAAQCAPRARRAILRMRLATQVDSASCHSSAARGSRHTASAAAAAASSTAVRRRGWPLQPQHDRHRAHHAVGLGRDHHRSTARGPVAGGERRQQVVRGNECRATRSAHGLRRWGHAGAGRRRRRRPPPRPG